MLVKSFSNMTLIQLYSYKYIKFAYNIFQSNRGDTYDF